MSSYSHTTLIDSLKEAIRERHTRMEALPFIAALTRGQLPLESYVGQLRAMAAIHGTLEHEFDQLNACKIRELMQDRPSRLAQLRRDLSVFDRQLIADIEPALDHTRKIAETIRRYRVEQPTDLLGILYVLEGTTLGNAVHLPDVLKNFGDRTDGTAHYYTGYGDKTAGVWLNFCCALNAFPLDLDGYQRLIRVALDFFDRLEDLFSALYPLQSSSMVFSAGMFNPEAGDHAVSRDAQEIEAALAAARRCREEFPYFEERYQERGRSFAKSDATWLVTLVELPQTQLLSQVEWLGRVLGNRGMPRITLERQLELLHEELSAAMPSKAVLYKGLLEAAAMLKRARLHCISEPIFSSLTSEFYQATDGELQGRFRRTGDLIVAAVCDEAAGVTDAITSLLTWLTESVRFSPQWTAAVLITLERAKDSANTSKLQTQMT